MGSKASGKPRAIRKATHGSVSCGQGEICLADEFILETEGLTKEFAGFFGLTYLKTGDQFVHSLATAVISPDGKLLELRRGNDWEPKDLVEDLKRAAAGQKARGETASR